MRIVRWVKGQKIGADWARVNGRPDGFTLIEVVLALTIFALMSAILYGVFALGHNAVQKTQANAGLKLKQRSVRGLAGSYIRSAFPYQEAAQDPPTFFLSETHNLSFVSAYSQGIGVRRQ